MQQAKIFPHERAAMQRKGLRITYPRSWTAEDDGEELSLWRSREGGAITVSSYRHRDTQFLADALEKCRSFVASRGQDTAVARGNSSAAEAEFQDAEGVRWVIRTVARGNRFALATYNSARRHEAEEQEMRNILAGIELTKQEDEDR